MNCILLPATNFQHDNASAYINDLAQIAHVNKVLNAQVGDRLKIGQLGGKLGSAIIKTITSDSIQLSDIQLNNNPPAKLNLIVVLALPRPKVLRRLIMDMTALGVNDIILINSYRTQKSYWQSPMLARLDEFVLEGLQQGVDTIAPRISLQKRFKPFVEDELASLMTNRAIVAHPYSALSFAQYVQQNQSQLMNRLYQVWYLSVQKAAGLIMRLSCLLSKDVRQLISGHASYVPKPQSMSF